MAWSPTLLREMTFERAMVDRFIELVDDRNPLHRDDDLARTLGMEKANTPGVLIAAVLTAAALEHGLDVSTATFVFRRWCYVDRALQLWQTSPTRLELRDSHEVLVRLTIASGSADEGDKAANTDYDETVKDRNPS